MHRARVMIVHTPHPVRQPSGAYFQKDKFDSWVFLHDTAADQRHNANHQVNRHANHVNVKVSLLKSLLTRAVKAAGYPMDANGRAELIGFTKERIKVRVIE